MVKTWNLIFSEIYYILYTMANLNLHQQTTGTAFKSCWRKNEYRISRTDELFDKLIEVNTSAIEPTPG